jgi:hypothetical protein
LNNNNTIRVNLNNVNQQPAAAAAAQPQQGAQEGEGERNLNDESAANESLRTAAVMPEEPQVPFATVLKTFVISFFSSIIPEAPAL